MTGEHSAPTGIARVIRLQTAPIIVFWLGLAVATSVVVPPLEIVSEHNAVSLSPQDAPALIAMKRLGKQFQQFDSDSLAMIVLEADHPLDQEAHRYYDGLVRD